MIHNEDPSRRLFLQTAALAAGGLMLGRAAATAANGTAPTMPADTLDFQKLMRPVPRTAVFQMDDWYIWCGSPIKGDDGKYHLFYSRWPKKLGFEAWVTHSEIAHAVADSLFAPFLHHDLTLPPRGKDAWDGLCTHNPTILRFNKKYYLYYMGNTGDGKPTKSLNWSHRNNQRIGVAVADNPAGPWTRFDTPLIDVTPGFHDALCCNNPSVTRGPDGRYLMVYKAVNRLKPLPFGGPVLHIAATADSPTGPFTKHPDPVFHAPGVHFAAEDPFIWFAGDRFRAIVKDFAGHFTKASGKSTALFESPDGLHWKLSAHPLVATTTITWDDGQTEKMDLLERPQLLLEDGKPRALFFACSPTAKRSHSFNIHIPLAID